MPTVAELRQRFAAERQREAASLPLPLLQPGNASIAPLGPKPPPLPEARYQRHGRRPNNKKALLGVGVGVSLNGEQHPNSRIEIASPILAAHQSQAPAEQTNSSHACARLHHPNLDVTWRAHGHAISEDADSDSVTSQVEVEVEVDVTAFVEREPEHTPRAASAAAHQLRAAEIKEFMAQHFRDECASAITTSAAEQQQHQTTAVADPEPESTIRNTIRSISSSATQAQSRDVANDDDTDSSSEADLLRPTSNSESDSDDDDEDYVSADDVGSESDGSDESSDDDEDAISSAEPTSDDNDNDDETDGSSVSSTDSDSPTIFKRIESSRVDDREVDTKEQPPKFVHGRATISKKKKKKQPHRHAAAAIIASNKKKTKSKKPAQHSAHEQVHHEKTHGTRKRIRSVPYKRRRKDGGNNDDSSTSDDGVGRVDPAYKTSWVLEALKFMLPPILLLPVFFVIRCFVVIPLRACGRALISSTRSARRRVLTPVATLCGVVFRSPLRVGRAIRQLVGWCYRSMVFFFARVLNRLLCRKPRKGKRKRPSIGRLLVRVIASFGRYSRASFNWVLYSPVRLKRALARTGRDTRLFVRENWEEVLDVLAALAGLLVLISIFVFIVVPLLVKLGVLSFWGLHLFGLGKFYTAIGVVDSPNKLEQWLYHV